MKKTYQIIDQYAEDGTVYYATLDTDADTNEIQLYLWDQQEKYREWQDGEIEDEEIENGCFSCEMEYALYKLQGKFNGEVIDTDGTLYY